MSGDVVIGLDVGTTAVKAVAFAVGSPWRVLAVRDIEPGAVQDLDAIAAAVTSALGECAAGCAGRRVVALSVSTAMHGLVALDADKRPLTPLVTWADGRAADQAWRLHASGEAVELHRSSGAPVHPMTPLTKLLWFREQAPDVWARARWWVGLKDYVLWHLTDSLVTELSSASGTGMLDMAARDWNPKAVALTGVGHERLPPVLRTTAWLELSPARAAATGLPAGTAVVVGGADGPLGNLGTGAMSPGVAGLSLGTSGAVRVVMPEPYVDPANRLFSYALTDDAWVIGGAVGNGGSVVRWAGEVFAADLAPGQLRDVALLELAERVPAGSDGLLMLPHLLPERAPVWRPEVRGAYLGLSSVHTRGHMVRAAVEGVAARLAGIVRDLERVHPVDTVRITGGAFRSAFWRTVVAATIDRPVVFASDAEGSALGAAALGLYALGRAPDLASAPATLDPAIADGVPVVISPEDAAGYRELGKERVALLARFGQADS